MNLLDARGTGFVLWNLRDGVKLWVRQLIHGELFAPVIGNKNRVGANRFDDERGEDALATPRAHAHVLAIVDLELHGCLRMNLNVRLRALLYEKAYATSLIA